MKVSCRTYILKGVTAMNVRRWATEKLELPADVLCRWPVITLSGRERLYVENHRGLCEYAQDKVRIKTSCGVLCICGDQMVLDELLPLARARL